MNEYAQLAEKVFTGGAVLFGISTLLLKKQLVGFNEYSRKIPRSQYAF